MCNITFARAVTNISTWLTTTKYQMAKLKACYPWKPQLNSWRSLKTFC